MRLIVPGANNYQSRAFILIEAVWLFGGVQKLLTFPNTNNMGLVGKNTVNRKVFAGRLDFVWGEKFCCICVGFLKPGMLG